MDGDDAYLLVSLRRLPKQSEAILASKYAAATRRVWSAEEAFAVGPKPEQLEVDDKQDFDVPGP